MRQWSFIIAIAFSLAGCATTSGPGPSRQPTMILNDPDDASSAEGSAYTADAMHFRKPMPSRPDWRPLEFYFKHCSELGEESYFSKTSYECTTGP